MIRIIVFGNSAAGKTTLAGELRAKHGLAHLDLDTLAWENTTPPTRKPLEQSLRAMRTFLDTQANWVIEGCYSDLIRLVLAEATEIVFLNPGIDACVENCRNRPWEPHKYASPEQQNRNLAMLLAWIREYETRTDEFSLRSHRDLFTAFRGKKTEIKQNPPKV